MFEVVSSCVKRIDSNWQKRRSWINYVGKYKGKLEPCANHCDNSLSRKWASFTEFSKCWTNAEILAAMFNFLFAGVVTGRNDTWVDEGETNKRLRQGFWICQQGSPGLLQTLSVLISVTMAMDAKCSRSLFNRLPTVPNLLQVATHPQPS